MKWWATMRVSGGVVVWMLAIILAGCTLGQRDRDQATLTALQPTNANSPGANPPAVTNPSQPTASLPTPTSSIPCVPRSDWFLYTVQAGDTLSGIANRVGTTLDELIRGNCLEAPDTLDVGQTVLVPIVPSPPVQGDECIADEVYLNTGTDYVVIAPFLSFDGECYGLQPGSTVTVSWPGAPPGTTEVTFYRNNATLPRADVIGVDTVAADGFSIVYVVPTEMQPSAVYAFGVGNTPNSASDSDAVSIFLGR
ncbi:MAG: LysM peptidoglycan-binding domain-containing protein [bacterium]|nr:LysM peptidoglycan-binding domain-containing protein [bacterium]